MGSYVVELSSRAAKILDKMNGKPNFKQAVKHHAINQELKAAGLYLLKLGKPAGAAASSGNHLKAFSLFKNLAGIPAFILSANLTGSPPSGIMAFHFLSFTESFIESFLPIHIYKHFHHFKGGGKLLAV